MYLRRQQFVNAQYKAKALKTFGKLDDKDIEEIDGQPERLVVELMKHYGWDADFARRRVKQCHLDLLDDAENSGAVPRDGPVQ